MAQSASITRLAVNCPMNDMAAVLCRKPFAVRTENTAALLDTGNGIYFFPFG